MVFAIAFVCYLFTWFSSHLNVEICVGNNRRFASLQCIQMGRNESHLNHTQHKYFVLYAIFHLILSDCAFGDAAKWTNTVTANSKRTAAKLALCCNHNKRIGWISHVIWALQIRLKLNFCLDEIRTDHRPEIYCYLYRFVFIWAMKLGAESNALKCCRKPHYNQHSPSDHQECIHKLMCTAFIWVEIATTINHDSCQHLIAYLLTFALLRGPKIESLGFYPLSH